MRRGTLPRAEDVFFLKTDELDDVLSAEYPPEVKVNFEGAGMPRPRQPTVVPVMVSLPRKWSRLGIRAPYEMR